MYYQEEMGEGDSSDEEIIKDKKMLREKLKKVSKNMQIGKDVKNEVQNLKDIK